MIISDDELQGPWPAAFTAHTLNSYSWFSIRLVTLLGINIRSSLYSYVQGVIYKKKLISIRTRHKKFLPCNDLGSLDLCYSKMIKYLQFFLNTHTTYFYTFKLRLSKLSKVTKYTLIFQINKHVYFCKISTQI